VDLPTPPFPLSTRITCFTSIFDRGGSPFWGWGAGPEEQLEQFSSHFVSLAGAGFVMVKFILGYEGNCCISSV
jgi:hypothetical protein